MARSTKKIARPFDVSKALRGLSGHIPQGKFSCVEEYIRQFSRLNGHKEVEYIINGKKVII